MSKLCSPVLAGHSIDLKSYSVTDHSVYGTETHGSTTPSGMARDNSYKEPAPLAADIEPMYDEVDALAR